MTTGPSIQIDNVDSEFLHFSEPESTLHPMYQFVTLPLHDSNNFTPSLHTSSALSYSPADVSIVSCSPSSDGDFIPDFAEGNPHADPAIFSDYGDWELGMSFSPSMQQPFEKMLATIGTKQFDNSYLYPAHHNTFYHPSLYGTSPYSSTSSLPSQSSQSSHAAFSPGSASQFTNVCSSPVPDSSNLSDNATRIPTQHHRRFGGYNLRGRILNFRPIAGRLVSSNLQTLKEGVELGSEPPSGSSQVVKQQVTSKATKAASEKRRRTEPKHFCAICGEGFTTKHNLKNHANSHAGIKAHACTHTGCGKSFNTKSDRKRHERIHEKESILFTAANFTTRLNPF